MPYTSLRFGYSREPHLIWAGKLLANLKSLGFSGIELEVEFLVEVNGAYHRGLLSEEEYRELVSLDLDTISRG